MSAAPGQLGWEGVSGGVEPASPPAPGGLALLNQQLFAPPDRQSYNASARRRLFATSGSVSVPLSSSNTASAIITLPDQFTQNDGLFTELITGIVTPGDALGHLTIVDASLQLGNGSNLFLPIGTPQPTTLIPRVGTSLLFTPVPLITAKDMDEWSRLAGAGSIYAFVPQQITVQLSVSMVNNDASAAHTFSVRLWLGERFINGLTGA